MLDELRDTGHEVGKHRVACLLRENEGTRFVGRDARQFATLLQIAATQARAALSNRRDK